ncbi:MAG TPA: four helix bundle protein [Longimicrobiaceae bacterium]|nr:four helix bundle protein [Longimicrobiaceae bacterium]
MWQKARALCVEIYRVSGSGRFARDFGLRDQIQRAAVSVMSNVAEGFERSSHAEFARFLTIAQASAAEVRSQLYIAHDLDYLDAPATQRLTQACMDIRSDLIALRSSLRS